MAVRLAETPTTPTAPPLPAWRQRLNHIFPISHATNELPALDGLRAIAISLVFLYHTWGSNPALMHLPFGIRSRFMSTLGPMGVLLFFVLSGFLLFQPYARALVARAPRLPDTRTFYTRRARRILPAYWSSVIIIGIIGATILPDIMTLPGWWLVLGHLTFLYTFFPNALHSLNGVFWSLGIEIQFYIILPALAWIVGWLGRRIGGPGRALALLLGAILGLSIGWRLLFGAILTLSFDYRFMLDQLPSLLVAFATGMGCSYLYTFVQQTEKAAPRPHPYRAIAATLLGLVGLAETVYATGFLNINPSFFYPSLRRGSAFTFGLDWDIFVTLGWGAVVLAVLFGHGLWRSTLSLWPLRVLALISYSFYIWHYLIIERLVEPYIFDHYHLDNEFYPVAGISFGLSFAVALAYFHLFERPYLRQKTRPAATGITKTAPAP